MADRDAPDHLLRRSAGLSGRDLAGFDGIIGAIPPADADVAVLGGIQLQQRRFAFPQAEAFAYLRNFAVIGANPQIGAALSVALGAEVEAAVFGNPGSFLSLAGGNQPA